MAMPAHAKLDMKVKCPMDGKEKSAYGCLHCPRKLLYNEWRVYCRT